jgi:ATP/maltotriose-dependent transcriptional regulator MalT
VDGRLSTQTTELLSTKLALPRTRASLVTRGALLIQLDTALERKLTMLSAPAGFGKTTLARAWLDTYHLEHGTLPVAWVSLDAGDNDPVRFWRYVITACQRFDMPTPSSALALLGHVQRLSLDTSGDISFEAVLTELINHLARLSSNDILVLEDYHVIRAPIIHETVARLIEHLPPAVHVLLISRGDLPLPLARLRAQGDLLELHAADLRFSLAETRLFLQDALPFALSEEMVATIQARTEGWIAGLRLLALALQRRAGQQACEHFLATFTGRHRHILEYLVGDVLTTQPESLQMFLLQTSGLTRLSGSLCDAITGRSDSELLLEQLERMGLFLESLDGSGQWYRYHALFAEAMRHEARRRLGDDLLHASVNKASDWYEQHDMLNEAVETALLAQDHERAATLIEKLVISGRFAELQEFFTLRRWSEQLPREILCEHPVICVVYASALLFPVDPQREKNRANIEDLLRIAEERWHAQAFTYGLGIVSSFRSLTTLWQQDMERANDLAQQSLTLLPEEDVTWRSISLGVIATSDLRAGQLNKVRTAVVTALAGHTSAGNSYAARASKLTLAEVCYGQSELHQAETLYRDVLENSGNDLDDRRRALLGLAYLSYEWNSLDTAWELVQEANNLSMSNYYEDEAFRAKAELFSIWILHARSSREEAMQRLQQLLIRVESSAFSTSQEVYREALVCRNRLRLIEGHLSSAQQWLTSRPQILGELPQVQSEQEALLMVRLLIAQGELEEALSLLEHWQVSAQQAGRKRSSLEIQVLKALAYAACKQISEARQQLCEALMLAQPEGYHRLFIDEGQEMIPLLRALLPTVQELSLRAYIEALLQSFNTLSSEKTINPCVPPTQAVGMLELLSPQELRVLRLLATGRSNPEIAKELVVSVNTVRTQVQSIYHKLLVNNRVEAVAVAQRMQLL